MNSLGMLSRTAEDLYWMARYMERAENLARLLDAAHTLSLLPQSAGNSGLELLLHSTGNLDNYQQYHGRLQPQSIITFFTLERDNAASIFHCLMCARTAAHAVRGNITTDMWESINGTWIELRDIPRQDIHSLGVSHFCDWIKERCYQFHGATLSTSILNDALRFIQLGTTIERADNSLRLLGAWLRNPPETGSAQGTAINLYYYQWTALLRALAAFESYSERYRGALTARDVTAHLLFSDELSRSLRTCCDRLFQLLQALPGNTGQHARQLAQEQLEQVSGSRIDDVFSAGSDEWIGEQAFRIRQLADAIRRDYLEPI